MSKRRIAQAMFLSIAGIIVFLVIYTILKSPESTSPPLSITLQPRPTAVPASPTPATISVYVSGAVYKADVYALALNSIVKDAIAAAGGATADADLDRINLALRLSDQMHVHVPRRGEALPTPDKKSPATLSAPINVNTATLEELDTLPGIGPVLAKVIVDYRTQHGPFKKIEDINDVKGIGDVLYDKIKGLITVGP